MYTNTLFMIALASLAANFSNASSIYTKDGTLASVQDLQKSSFHFLKRELLTDKGELPYHQGLTMDYVHRGGVAEEW